MTTGKLMSSDLRPTSPHLTIYRPQITSVLSILHRITGVALSVGAALMVAWLYVAAYVPANYAPLYEWMSSSLGRMLMVGWTLAFYYHLANGLRHLFWDMGKGFALATMARSGWAVLLFTALMTAITWCPYFSSSSN